MKPFEQGPTPWTDAGVFYPADEQHCSENTQAVMAERVRALERRCRAAEALLSRLAALPLGCRPADPFMREAERHLEAAKEMDR